MPDLTTLPLQFDVETGICRAIIETPKGCRNKFDYDTESGLFMLGGLLPEA
jgi:inorganic pyrophosphatase